MSSPLKRCIDTALIITGFKEQDILKFDDFRELNFGLWEGLNYEEIAEKYPKDWDLWKRDWKNGQPTKGENFMNMYKRVIKTLTSFLQNCTGGKVLIVSHKGCLQIIASYLLTKDENLFWNFDFQQGKYSVFEIKEGFCVIKKINC